MSNRRFGAALLAMVVTVLLGACGGSDGDAGADAVTGEVANQAEAPEPGARGRAVAYSADSTGAGGGGSATGGSAGGGGEKFAATEEDTGGGRPELIDPIGEVPDARPHVIKTAQVSIRVPRDSLDAAVRDGVEIAGRYGGFVLSTTMEERDKGSAEVVVRVPSEVFEQALADLEGLGKVTREQISGRDVGQEFVDLEARIRNLEAQETVMLRLMDRAQSVAATIKVQRELQGIQLQIERLTGRLRYLKDQADMSTVQLSFVEAGAPGRDAGDPGMLERAWNRAVDLAMGVVAAIIVSTGIVVPLAVLIGAAYLLVRLLRPRLSS